MKFIIKIVTIFTVITFLIFTLNSCKRDGDKYKVKGFFIESCNNSTPVKNFKLDLYETNYQCRQEYLASTTTNEKGEFEFNYSKAKKASCVGGLSIKYDNSFSTALVAYNISANESIDIGTVYNDTRNTAYIIILKTNTNYTNQDTLFYDIAPKSSGIDSTYQYVTGPFQDGKAIDTLFVKFSVEKAIKDELLTNYQLGRWILKSEGKALIPQKPSQNFYVEPCRHDNEVVIDISK